MSGQSTTYADQVSSINKKATALRAAIIDPQIGDNGFIQDRKQRNQRLSQAISGSIFESAGSEESAGFVLAASANAIRAYEKQHGHLPDDELLANGFDSIQNIFEATSNGFATSQKGRIFESAAALSTTNGIIMRDHMAALVMPVMLTTITPAMATSVPGTFNRSEIFKINRRAGSTFGDLTKGDIIDETFAGQYSSMDQIKPMVGDVDGTNKAFTLDVGMPLKKGGVSEGGYTSILLDRNVIAKDNGKGQIYGEGIATATVDYDTGEISVTFTVAPEADLEIHAAFDIDIEKDPTLIPIVEHDMESWVLLPHESAISSVHTVQAFHALQREYNVDSNNLDLTAMRNVLAADKDRKNLKLMYFAAQGATTFVAAVPEGITQRQHYESIRETLLQISTDLMTKTRKSGLRGVIAGNGVCRLFRSLGRDDFTPAPNYREVPQPHYVGRIFGMYDLYCDPQKSSDEALCYAKGRDYGDAGLVAADVLTAIPYADDTRAADLRYRNTIWDLAYRQIHPDNGRAFFTNLIIDRTPA